MKDAFGHTQTDQALESANSPVLTKREYFAMHALHIVKPEAGNFIRPNELASRAVKIADALIEELSK